jgi:two-component system, OmpR family, sensor histidine kinase CssS
MKRFRLWVRELSLLQQILCIIFLFIAIFAGFLFFFITPAIDRFSETEMYEQLHTSQNTIIDYINENPDEETVVYGTDTSIIQLMYDPDSNDLKYLNETSLNKEVLSDIQDQAEETKSGTQDYVVEVDEENQANVKYLYSITLLKDGRELISVMPDTYRVAFRKSLISGVVMMNILVVSVLLALLLMWVGTFIYPLQQIKLYIQKIKNDEPATLTVKRNDEIGEVAEALTEMQSALDKQNREKEEMIQNISHDLKTPIATIKSYSEAIKDGIYPYDTLEKSIDVIIEHAERLEKKVKSLIILNKMGYLLDKCPEGDNLDMNEVIEKVVLSLKVVRPEIQIISNTEKNIKFHGEEEPWRITVENLMDNALRYAKSTVTVELKKDELRVINDGRQIEEDRLPTLFHPYEKGTDGQFGLGLSIVYRVCTTYGYHVQAENLQNGTSFRIWKEHSKNRASKRNKQQ